MVVNIQEKPLNKLYYDLNYKQLFDRVGSLILVGIMWGLMGFNTLNADSQVYRNLYYKILNQGIQADPNIEVGFRWLMFLGTKITSEYQFFLMGVSFICLLFLPWIIRLYTPYTFIPLSLFFIYGFQSNSIQLRSFIAMEFFYIGLYFLLKNNQWINTTLYMILLLFASLFHVSILFYSILLLFRLNKKIIFLVVIFLSIVIKFSSKYFSGWFLETKFQGYIDSSMKTNWLLAIYYISNYFFVSQFQRIFQNISLEDRSYLPNLNDKNDNQNWILSLDRINLLVSTSLLLVFINNNFIRLLRNLMLLNYMAYNEILRKSIRKTQWINYYIYIIYVIYIFITFYVLIYSNANSYLSFHTFFENNLLINWYFSK